MHMPASLSNEDRQYLASKGVFTLPGKEACDSLIRAYFRHVHPIMPIIEADQLLGAVAAGRLGDYNVLLMWSVFFVAVNVCPAPFTSSEMFLLDWVNGWDSLFRYRYVRVRVMSPGRR